jgi:hypothetical protein
VTVRAIGAAGSFQGEDLDLKSDDGSFTIEVTAGSWEVRVASQKHPTVFAGTRELQAGTAWDLGTIQLSNGGTLVVRDDGSKYRDFWIRDAHEQSRGSLGPGTPRRSELLPPGDHLLLVRGKGIAAQALPFTIRSGKETELEVRPVAGVRQRFEFAPAPGTELPPRIGFEVRRAGKLITFCSEDDSKQAVRTGEIWLEPGEYTLVSRTEGREGTARVVIGREEGPLVRITLR